MITLQISNNTIEARTLIEKLKKLPNVLEVEEEYSPEFVKRVLKAAKGKRTLMDNKKTLWENLELK
jgi:hypothetical protein